MAAHQNTVMFVRGIDGMTMTVDYEADMTIGDVKRQIALQKRIPVESMRLVGGGVAYQDHRTVASYSISRSTTLTLVLTAASADAAPSSPAAAGWRRSAVEPMPTYAERAFPIPGGADLGNKQIFVWCVATEHQPVAVDSYDDAYPQQVQPGKVRPRCSACQLDWVELDQAAVDWSQLFAGTATGRCNACNKTVAIEFVFRCGGDRLTPSADGRSVCNAESTEGYTVLLPGVERGRPGRASIDTSAVDPLQVVSHPCGHAVNANGLNLSMMNADRSRLLQNALHPDRFGHTAVKCFDLNCTAAGAVFLPTVKLAGPNTYRRVKDWGVKEQVLQDGGLICHRCQYAFAAPPTQWRHFCPNCLEDICEQCSDRFADCVHGRRWQPTEDDQLAVAIASAIAHGQIGACPRGCLSEFGTQKDSACTHMECELCSAKWCYFCGKERSEYFCSNGCPWYLNRYHLTQAGDELGALVAFHRIKILRLLNQLRRTEEEKPGRAGAFDRVFAALPAEQRTFSCVMLEQRTCVIEPADLPQWPLAGDFLVYPQMFAPPHVVERRPLIEWP